MTFIEAAMCCNKNGHPFHEFVSTTSIGEQIAGAVFMVAVVGLILLLMKMDWRRQDVAKQTRKDGEALPPEV
jgi:hypothetical protein